jgi:hypothetical protein
MCHINDPANIFAVAGMLQGKYANQKKGSKVHQLNTLISPSLSELYFRSNEGTFLHSVTLLC